VDLVRGAKGEILSDDFLIPIRAGKTPVLEPYLMGNLHRLKVWDGQDLLEDLKRGRYTYIVLIDRLQDDFSVLMPVFSEFFKKKDSYRSKRPNFNRYTWKVLEYNL